MLCLIALPGSSTSVHSLPPLPISAFHKTRTSYRRVGQGHCSAYNQPSFLMAQLAHCTGVLQRISRTAYFAQRSSFSSAIIPTKERTMPTSRVYTRLPSRLYFFLVPRHQSIQKQLGHQYYSVPHRVFVPINVLEPHCYSLRLPDC
jgi:hypothetical protein